MDRRAARRSVQAFREALRFIDAGGLVAITPDAPRAPPPVLPQGPLMRARARQSPVLLYGLAARPALTLKATGQDQDPPALRPHGCVVFDGPHAIAHDAEPNVIEATRVDWEARLTAAQDRAEALLAG